MQALKQENQQLRRYIENILQDIENQKEINTQHETEIQTLLQFNERLLSIIETQISNKKDKASLQPISQRSERESDLVPAALNSFLRTKKNAVRSQKGQDSQYSFFDGGWTTNSRLNDFVKQKEILRSELSKSYQNEDFSQHKLQYKTTSDGISPLPSNPQIYYSSRGQEVARAIETSKKVTEQMNQEIAEFKRYRKESANFYDKKISQVKYLSSRITNYRPLDQLNHITKKLTISKGTTQLIQRTMQTKHSKR